MKKGGARKKVLKKRSEYISKGKENIFENLEDMRNREEEDEVKSKRKKRSLSASGEWIFNIHNF